MKQNEAQSACAGSTNKGELSRGSISLGLGKVSNQRGQVDFSRALISPADTVLPRDEPMTSC